jgi:50S ribosomal subunit-associated GTPase HflX
LVGYDQVLSEDGKTNRMSDTMDVFTEIVNSKSMPTQNMVLFLNKKDLFEKKVKESNIKDNFPAFVGISIIKKAKKRILQMEFHISELNSAKGTSLVDC